ncbi:MAG: DcrB-related protein [Deltaproteobacteria bacterium]|jgi:hypothetical protein|nr:DcrB-related protein [Deltaproteobacteria bacterium]
MRYRFRELAFEVQDGLVDQSMIVLVDEERCALTVARELLQGPLSRYVDEAVTELEGSMEDYRLVDRQERTVAGRPALILEQAARTPEGRAVTQLQAYVELGADVVVVTATSPAEHTAAGRGHFDRALASLTVA